MTITPSTSSVSGEFAVKVDKTGRSEWHRLMEGFDDANVYQTWDYGAVHWSADELSHLVLERDGNTLAMVQSRIVQLPFIKKGMAYIRWGPLCRLKGQSFDVQIFERMSAAIKAEYVDRRGLLLHVLPPVFETDSFSTSFCSLWSALGLKRKPEARAYRTILVDLAPSLEDIRKRLGGKWRNKLSGAERNGLTIAEGSDLSLYDRFMVAYRQLMARKQFETTVDVAEFRTIQEQLPEPLKMRIFLCEKDGQLLNALIVSAIGDTAIYLLGATTDEGTKLKGAYLLQWRAMQWLKERGCRWYDLGGINPAVNPGVYEFKSGFGGEETSHLGTFELPGDWMSTLCVRAGEQGQAMLRKLRSWNRGDKAVTVRS